MIYTVERVLKTSKRGEKIEDFVKWKGYGYKFNTCFLKEDVIVCIMDQFDIRLTSNNSMNI